METSWNIFENNGTNIVFATTRRIPRLMVVRGSGHVVVSGEVGGIWGLVVLFGICCYLVVLV